MKNEDRILLYNADFIGEIKRIVTQARQKAYTAINSAMVEAYWQMGKRIVEQEQQGKDRADYGSQLLKSLSKELTAEFGKGFSVNSLYYFRQFYLAFPEKLPTAWGILTWSHYKRLLSVSNVNARTWYLKEAAEQMWSYRTLDRNIGSQYYERLLLSQHKDTVEGEMKALTAPFDKDRMEFIKNPTVAEFIGPMSPNPEKLLIVDGHTPPAETEPYLDYYVKQNYGSSSVSFTSTFPYEKQVFTENIGAYWQTGGGMEAQAAAKAPEGHFKGGFGAFFCLRDYHTSDSGADKEIPYGHLRRAIQLQNPAVTK